VTDFFFIFILGPDTLDVVNGGIIELKVDTVLSISKHVGLVDLGGIGELSIGLQTAGLVHEVLHDNICLVVLKVSETKKDDVSLVDPNLDQQRQQQQQQQQKSRREEKIE